MSELALYLIFIANLLLFPIMLFHIVKLQWLGFHFLSSQKSNYDSDVKKIATSFCCLLGTIFLGFLNHGIKLLFCGSNEAYIQWLNEHSTELRSLILPTFILVFGVSLVSRLVRAYKVKNEASAPSPNEATSDEHDYDDNEIDKILYVIHKRY